jgi:DNA modification methylase
MTLALIRADALALPIADSTVDLIVTSPPYFGLRSYTDGGQHYPGQIGSEATPSEWLAAMLAATAEMMRCLKPSGSIWINLGDKYAGSSIDNRDRPPGPTLNNPKNSSMRSGGVIRPPKTTVRP